MTDSHGPSNNFKSKILDECKRLSSNGELIEATRLFYAYFPEKRFHDLDKMHV